jgi:hypothetical protein
MEAAMEQGLAFILMTMIIGAPFVALAWLADYLTESEKL